MLNSNARRAMAAAAGGSHITQIATANLSTDTAAYVEALGGFIEGSTTPNVLQVSASTTLGWSFELGLFNADDSEVAYHYSLASWNGSNVAAEAGQHLYVNAAYVGAGTLPQSTTVTIRNASFGNEVVWIINATINPEPV